MCYSALVKNSLKHLEKTFGKLSVRIDETISWDLSAESTRIYPGYNGPVVCSDRNGILAVQPMRYGTYPPLKLEQAKRYTSFNARLDNINSFFWSNAVAKNHGVVEILAFYEWVTVEDLVQGGSVHLEEIKNYFAEKDENKSKISNSTKKTKVTKTSKKIVPLEKRKIVLKFSTPGSEAPLLAPVVFSSHPKIPGHCGFALITSEPLPEVAVVGHDRSPIFIHQRVVSDWLKITSVRDAEDFLTNSQNKPVFSPEIAN